MNTMRQHIRNIAIKLPKLRQLVEQRDELLRQVGALSADLETERVALRAAGSESEKQRDQLLRQVEALSADLETERVALRAARSEIEELRDELRRQVGALSADLETERAALRVARSEIEELQARARIESPDIRDSATKVALLQISKTGGTTLSRRLMNVCAPNELVIDPLNHKYNGLGHMQRRAVEQQLRGFPASNLEQLRILAGHLPFGFDDCIGTKFSYVSFFRSPIDRMLSGFLYGCGDQLKVDKEWLKFALHLAVSVGGAGFDNAVTRLLTGSEVLIPTSPQTTIWELPRVTISDRELVIDRLRRRFGFVGLTERFEDSCRMLFRLLGKPYEPSALRLNETALELDVAEVPLGTLQLLEQRLAHDIAVYAAACDKFNEFASQDALPLADPYVRRTPEAGAFSSGDHAHLVDAQSAFGLLPDDVWLSCPIFRKKSGELIGYHFAEPYHCPAVTIQVMPIKPARKLAFLVQASDDEFGEDVRTIHQIVVNADGQRRQIEMPEHYVAARSWRLWRVTRVSVGPLQISYLRFGADDGSPRDLDAVEQKVASVRERFQCEIY